MPVLYYKESEAIEDFLTTIGAQKASLNVMEAKIMKSMRNDANRAINCEIANMGKTAKAAAAQYEAIREMIHGYTRESGVRKLERCFAEVCRKSAMQILSQETPKRITVTGNGFLHNMVRIITGTLIERPHSFATACNIATQIVAQVASNQYGGQSISLTHLAPFVQVSREKIRKTVEKEMAVFGVSADEQTISKVVEERLRDEVRRGVQTIQYQVVTLLTTNGQAPWYGNGRSGSPPFQYRKDTRR